MHILVISNLVPPAIRGGYEVECAAVCEYLRTNGHDVRVLTSREGLETPPQRGVLRALWFLKGTARGSLLAPLASIAAARTIRKELAAHGPFDLIWCWNGANIPQCVIRIASLSGTPFAFRVCEHWFSRLYVSDQFMRHLHPGERGLLGLWARLMRLVNRLPVLKLETDLPARAWISWNSDSIRSESTIPEGVLAVGERVILSTPPNGPRFAEIVRSPSETPTILFVGRVESQKGVEVAYRALARLRAKYDLDASLLVAGTGDAVYVDKLDRLADDLGVAAHIQRLGSLDLDALASVMATAHVQVVPSIWLEPTGMVCIEAALARVPVVASDIGGIPEFLSNDNEALLVEAGDVEGFADAIARTLLDREETELRTIRARERAESFSFDRYLEESSRFVEEVVGSSQ